MGCEPSTSVTPRKAPSSAEESTSMHLNSARCPRFIFLEQEAQQEHQGRNHCKQPVDVNIRESLSLCVQRFVHFGQRGLLRGIQIKTSMGQARCELCNGCVELGRTRVCSEYGLMI